MPRAICACLGAAALIAGCGSGAGHGGSSATRPASTAGSASTGSGAAAAPASLTAAQHPRPGDFPPANGRSVLALQKLLAVQAHVGVATELATPGTNRVAFALLALDNSFIYAPTVVYVAASPNAPAQGPFPAPIDPIRVDARFASRAASGPGTIQAIYETQLPLPRPGNYGILAVARQNGQLVGGLTQTQVRSSSPIPRVGQVAPRVHTPTVASVHGNVASIDTRDPHDDMHQADLAAVAGHQPVALLFSTPALCQSRVCGPVTDLALQVESEFRGRVTFIHNEVYNANNPGQDLRPQLLAFHLETEPWLFTLDRRGRIAARLEGAFGIEAFRSAVRAALR
ncbi:MAG TPA: hypothetical protein VGN69_11050 [Solirubrobacteraceae bacterium]|jgi:hypothetical protein|nr:hypothetical protein [Solirubrobacteraceae bacterium]